MSSEFIGQAVPPKDIVTVTLALQAGYVTLTPSSEIINRHSRNAYNPPELGTACEPGIAL
jgi:hypothetical protein